MVADVFPLVQPDYITAIRHVSLELMSAPSFDPEQQASIRALLPAGADDVRIEFRGDDDTSPGRERKYVPGAEWAMHVLDQLAMCHREWADQQTGSISFKDKRDSLKRVAKGLQRELVKLHTSQLRQLSEDVKHLVDSYTLMAAENKPPKNSHRELIYGHLLDVWKRLGGKLSVTHDSYQETSVGPLVLYFKRVASLVLDEPPLSAHTIAEIVRREVRRQAGKPPRNRKRHKK